MPLLREQNTFQTKANLNKIKSKMKYQLKFVVITKSPEKLFKLQKEAKKNRSEIKIIKEKGKIIFDITAKDAIALKASANSVIKTLTIFEKTQNLVKND